MWTDLDIYRNKNEIIKVDCVNDTCCGIYPVFYAHDPQDKKKFIVSNSATKIIMYLGGFEENVNLKFIGGNYPATDETHDIRVKRLKALHDMSMLRKSIQWLTPLPEHLKHMNLPWVLGEDYFIKKQAMMITEWINWMENWHHGCKHVLMVGGKDSLIGLLVKKKHPENWIVFSGKPNADLVARFIHENNIEVGDFIIDDGKDNEDEAFVKEKIMATDGLTNPAHMRFFEHCRDLVEYHDEKIVFWLGTWGDALNANTIWKKDHINTVDDYWRFYYTRGARWQGAYHQMFQTLLGVPCYSIYHSPDMWKHLWMCYDTDIVRHHDVRDKLAEKIWGKLPIWPDKNPGPLPYHKQNLTIEQIKKIYMEGLKNG